MITVEKIEWQILVKLKYLNFNDFIELTHNIKEKISQGKEVPL